MKQMPLPIQAEPPSTFDDFAATGNEAVVQHLRALASSDSVAPPVYLWGPPGSGKTHLLRALAELARRAGRGVACFDAEAPVPWTLEPGVSLVVIDGCDRLDPSRQHAAFGLFVATADASAQVVAAGRLPPIDLPVRDDLRTRLGWGLVFALQPLADSGVRVALRRQAEARGLGLSDDVLDYLMTRFSRDMKHLATLLDRLDGFALAERRGALTVPMLKRMLAQDAEVPR